MISRVFEIGNGTQHDNTLGGHSAGRAGALGSASAATRYWAIRARHLPCHHEAWIYGNTRDRSKNRAHFKDASVPAEEDRSGPVRTVPLGRDVYDRLVTDVFVDGRHVAETLSAKHMPSRDLNVNV